MVPSSRAHRHVRGSALLLLCLGLIMLLPGRSGAAQVSGSQPQPIDNTQGDFADGEFQRTSIGPSNVSITAAAPDPADLPGVVQLAPAGALENWDSRLPDLPIAVADAGVTAVGKHIYVIGGTISGDTTATNAAYWATVIPTTGSLDASSGSAWNNSPMADAKLITDSGNTSACNDTYPTQRTHAGVASVTTGLNTGYIYVVGGAVNPGPDACVFGGVSTPLVQRGKVAADGSVVWTSMPYLPSPPQQPIVDSGTDGSRTLGVEGASVVISHVKSSTGVEHYYLYVIGGKSRYIKSANKSATDVRALSLVYYTEINIADGSLKHPVNGSALDGSPTNVWSRNTSITLVTPPATNEGLWDATATAANVEVGSTIQSAIFLYGGSLDPDDGVVNPTKLNSNLYRAKVDPDSGLLMDDLVTRQLKWSTGTKDGTQAVLAQRRGLASIAYNNKLYMIGGRSTDSASDGLAEVPTAFFDDNLDLFKISDTYFLGTAADVLNDGGRAPRSGIGAAIVRAEAPTTVVGTLNSAWVYAMGGTNGTLSSKIFVGKIGGDETKSTIRVPDGWYYSGVIPTTDFGNGVNTRARLLAIHWAADIDRAANPNADIQIEFRKAFTAGGKCEFDPIKDPSSAWRGPIHGIAGNASLYSQAATSTSTLYNSVNMSDVFGSEEIDAECIQYRAHLMQNVVPGGPITTPTSTPKLLSVYIEKVASGNADINIPANGLSVTTIGNHISSVSMKVQNLSDKGLDKTMSAELARQLSGVDSQGSIFVFLCKAYSAPGQPMPSLNLPDPNTNPPDSAVYTPTCPVVAQLLAHEMVSGRLIDLATSSTNDDGGPRWYDNATGQPISDILNQFSVNGNYRIGLVIDPGNYVPEGAVGEANNRGETTTFPNGQTVTFTVDGPRVYVVSLPLVVR